MHKYNPVCLMAFPSWSIAKYFELTAVKSLAEDVDITKVHSLRSWYINRDDFDRGCDWVSWSITLLGGATAYF